MSVTWERCLDRLEGDLTPEQLETYIRPLQVVEDGTILRLLAPNHFVRDWVDKHFLGLIREVVGRSETPAPDITVQIGSRESSSPAGEDEAAERAAADVPREPRPATGLRTEFTFENFVEGKSNQMARAASMQVATNPGGTDNNPCSSTAARGSARPT